MPVIRTEKKKNFTVIDNGFIRNMDLSLKAKGLLTLMLSLPEDWDYSARGLAAICKECANTVNRILRELEDHGYLTRIRKRDTQGHAILDIQYTICEAPQQAFFACTQNVYVENEDIENAHIQNEDIHFCTQLNKEESKKEERKKDEAITDPILSLGEETSRAAMGGSYAVGEADEEMDETWRSTPTLSHSSFSDGPLPFDEEPLSCEEYEEELRQTIRKNVELDILAEDPYFPRKQAEELVELAAEAAACREKSQWIGGASVSTATVRSRMLSLRGSHIQYVLECTEHTSAPIRNIKRYMLAALFNAPATIENYYHARLAQTDLWSVLPI